MPARLDSPRTVALVLFLALFAAQAGAIALAPVLAEVARDLDVSTATAGQLRTAAGLAAGITALALGRIGARVGLRRQLLAGSVLLALGSLASAAAPGLALLAAAQIPVGAGIAALTTAGTLAAAEWVPAEHRARTLSWALIGQPAAWIVGMPLLGVVGERSWRCAWLVLPLAAALVAGAVVVGRSDAAPAARAAMRPGGIGSVPGLGRWLAGEALANTAWAGTLVYSGALFVESYGASTETTGIVLALGAAAHVAGTMTMRRLGGREPQRLLVPFALVLAAAALLLGAVRPSLATSAVLFAAMAFAAGGRTFLASAHGLSAPPDVRPTAMALRAASMQFGYFAGSLVAGTALALGGYPALGATLGALFLGAAVVLAPWPRPSVPCEPVPVQG